MSSQQTKLSRRDREGLKGNREGVASKSYRNEKEEMGRCLMAASRDASMIQFVRQPMAWKPADWRRVHVPPYIPCILVGLQRT